MKQKNKILVLFMFVFLLVFVLLKTEAKTSSRPSLEDDKKYRTTFSNIAFESDIMKIETVEKPVSQDIKNIIDKGHITIGVYGDDRIAFFQEDPSLPKGNNLYGADIDLAKKIAKNLGVGVEFDRTAETYDQLVDLLVFDRVDLVISTFSDTPERSKYIDFSDPYFSAGIGMMINKQALVSKKMEENPVRYLKNNSENICVQEGSSYETIAKEILPNAKFIQVKDVKDGFELIKNNDGKAIAFFGSELEFVEQLSKSPIFSIFTKAYIFSDMDDRLCIGIKKGQNGLKLYVNECLKYANKPSLENLFISYKKAFGKK
ncbi:MAG: transporter substrate-binding domain-containing protein [Oscillospiraceae bacterium]|jgi:ABC-type amino acid transport substrate-binding protein|nr:transporter substrate-binding domain-containing protein [Oscillospiraceae bacterium]